MHFYTSINCNYLAKARVLAKSIKEHNRDSYFSLLLYDDIPADFQLEQEPFDEIVTLDDLELPVENRKLWYFLHNTTELGTAIKGQALLQFLKRSEKVVYLDPDIRVYYNLDELDHLLDTYACVLTPHQLDPDRFKTAIVGNEIGSMLRGTYNFGFYAANNSLSGIQFARWFRDRLIDYCYDDVPNGLFTDQRWGNLVPAMFDDVYIWRNPGCNVSTWNITNREVTGSAQEGYMVNGVPMLFYHFSGIDSGAQKAVLDLFSMGNKVLYELRDDYLMLTEQNDQSKLFQGKFEYDYFSNGEKIPMEARVFLRNREDLLTHFAQIDPYDVASSPSYYQFYKENGSTNQTVLMVNPDESNLYESSTSWRITKPLRTAGALVRKVLRKMKQLRG